MATFVEKDFAQLQADNQRIEDFKTFVLERFFLYARMTWKDFEKFEFGYYTVDNRILFDNKYDVKITCVWSGTTTTYAMPHEFIFNQNEEEKKFLLWEELNTRFA